MTLDTALGFVSVIISFLHLLVYFYWVAREGARGRSPRLMEELLAKQYLEGFIRGGRRVVTSPLLEREYNPV